MGNRRKKLERVEEIDALDVDYVTGLSCASSQWSLVSPIVVYCMSMNCKESTREINS